jgi:hypothetical protein
MVHGFGHLCSFPLFEWFERVQPTAARGVKSKAVNGCEERGGEVRGAALSGAVELLAGLEVGDGA